MIQLLNTEFEWSSFFEKTPDLVCVAGKDGFFRKVNPAVISKLGFTQDELIAKPIQSFIHPDDRELTQNNRTDLLAGELLLNFQNRYLAKNGAVVWLEWTYIYFPENEIVFAVAKDITHRKEVEKEVLEKYNRFKSLVSHFKSSIEKDRKFLAYELHEELAQLAAAVKMEVEMVALNVPGLPALAKTKMEHASTLAGLLMKTIQRISFSISPSMLDEFGLTDTVEWLCKEFSILNGIPCSFTCNYKEEKLSQEIKTDFFRICQESLSNVMYHAQADKVQVNIPEEKNTISLIISDDGKGFDLNQQKPSAGLISMRERAASINALLHIQSKAGEGTTIKVTVEK
jgi:PAS domain S-box-containing protein